MGLLNKSNKTKVVLTLGDICTVINVRIIRASNSHPKLSEDELVKRAGNLKADILWKKWDGTNVPTLGLMRKDKMLITGSIIGNNYTLIIQVIYADGSITEYRIRPIFDRELISGMSLRYHQWGYLIDEKWIPKHVMDSFLKMP